MNINKKKIINDPVYGFITIHSDLIFDIIEHPYFQRLRRIKQLGFTDLVYPGALHTRFHHAIGAMHLMSIALNNLRAKGHDISNEEYESALIAILLHDIGHGPFSHALEKSLLKSVKHESISRVIMQKLNKEFNGSLDIAIEIFNGTYPRPFLNQLVASQLDIDRLDYLQRDCFFTGVSEGTIGANRIIKMLDIINDEIVVEEKGIYSIENFLNARRLMYWQVYLHKAAISAEKMIIQILRRAKYLVRNGIDVQATPNLMFFLKTDVSKEDFENDTDAIKMFVDIDDFDIWAGVKYWCTHQDQILSLLSRHLLERKLFKITLENSPVTDDELLVIKNMTCEKLGIDRADVDYLVTSGSISNKAYIAKGKTINILTKGGEIVDVASASDLPNIKAISKIVKKYYKCCLKNIYL